MKNDYISQEDKQKLEEIIKLEKEGKLEFMSFEEFKQKSDERLEKIISSKKNAG